MTLGNSATSTGPNSIRPRLLVKTGIVAAERPRWLTMLPRHCAEPATSMFTRLGGSVAPLSQAAHASSATVANWSLIAEIYPS